MLLNQLADLLLKSWSAGRFKMESSLYPSLSREKELKKIVRYAKYRKQVLILQQNLL